LQETLVRRLAPRLRELGRGGYARTYLKGGRSYSASLRLVVAELLDSLGVRFRENVSLPGASLKADFEANGTFLFVDRELGREEIRAIVRSRSKVVVVRLSNERSDRDDAGIRVVELGSGATGRQQTIFIDDPSFNFDYAHILPHTQKCSVMHGHTSSALVEVIGEPVDGMVVDFGVAKEIVREAVRGLDHKLFINKKYVRRQDKRRVTLGFRTVHGDFRITAPKATTVLLDGEATVENLARVLLGRVSTKMPENVSAVGVYVYEGLNKGAHLLAQIHASGVEDSRKKS